MPSQMSDAVTGLVHRLLPPLPEKTSALSANTTALHILGLERLRGLLEQADSAATLDRWLTAEEQRLVTGFTLPKRKLEWLGGRLTAKASLLYLLTNHAPLPAPNRLAILPDRTGRPLLSSQDAPLPAKLSFSISHSGGHAATLACLDRPCGLDIQHLSPVLEGIKERFCTAAERRLLQECPQLARHSKIERLALLWSAKEAFRKAMHLSPLPGFLEMLLTAEPVPQPEAGAFSLAATFRRNGRQHDFSVTTWLHDNMAMAITIL